MRSVPSTKNGLARYWNMTLESGLVDALARGVPSQLELSALMSFHSCNKWAEIQAHVTRKVKQGTNTILEHPEGRLLRGCSIMTTRGGSEPTRIRDKNKKTGQIKRYNIYYTHQILSLKVMVAQR